MQENEWNRADAELAIALKRVELNNALHYKTKYDAEGHNICLALIHFRDGSTEVLAAYSNDSAIPESIRLGLHLVPNLYGSLSQAMRFGCDGMAQYHTEPKLLNYLCAPPFLRQGAFSGTLPRNPFYRSVLETQRKEAIRQAHRLKQSEEFASVTLVTEIDCCPTCTTYSINRFRARYPQTPLHTIELGKKVRESVPPHYKHVKVTRK